MFTLEVDCKKIGEWVEKKLTKYRLYFHGGQLVVFSKKPDLDGVSLSVEVEVGYNGNENFVRVRL